MSVSIQYTGEGIKTLLEKLSQLKQQAVYVGIPAEQNPAVEGAESFNMAALAAVLEFGNDRIPSRPFLRQTLAENAEKYTALFAELFQSGMEIGKIYGRIALIAQGDVQQNIVKGDWVANADTTKVAWWKSLAKNKGKKAPDASSISKKPLIWNSNLKNSIKGIVK